MHLHVIQPYWYNCVASLTACLWLKTKSIVSSHPLHNEKWFHHRSRFVDPVCRSLNPLPLGDIYTCSRMCHIRYALFSATNAGIRNPFLRVFLTLYYRSRSRLWRIRNLQLASHIICFWEVPVQSVFWTQLSRKAFNRSKTWILIHTTSDNSRTYRGLK